ncbi:MAG TPA: hypothetical protein VGC07_10275 [Granulicella sp.]
MATRRYFLAASAATALYSSSAARLLAQGPQPATLALAGGDGPQMPADFVGLSYEIQQLTEPSFFSPQNHGLIEQFRALSPHGVLRLGGNTSEFAWWKPTPETPEPVHPKTREVEGEPPAKFYPVTSEAVVNLAGFLKATGWTCLYGINLGTNTPERAADEAVFVAKTLGSSLQYFQVGNEADLYNRHLRDPQTWSFEAYLKEWLVMARAILKAVPSAKFGMPDVASDMSWLTDLGEAWAGISDPPPVTTLSHHFYFGGPATNPKVNIPALLSEVERTKQMAETATAAAKKVPGTRVRMTEGNTCYRGGKPGVSDVFAAALWSADYALTLASYGYSGVNLHGGTGQSVANSVGGVLPGDVMLHDAGETPDQIATHPHPFYTPVGTFGSIYKLEPVAYGLKFAGAFSGGTMLPVSFNAGGVNATAYASRLADGRISFIVLNKDAEKDLALVLSLPGKSGELNVETLMAPALDSRETGIYGLSRKISVKNGSASVTVPKASGMRLTLG